MANVHVLTAEELASQQAHMDRVRAFYEIHHITRPLAYVRTYGCQQNVADSEKMKGQLAQMGFDFTESPEDADFILFNTCAVREHAEDRVFGNVGALKKLKRQKPHLLIALCGCMVQQPHIAEKLYRSYPFVGLIFGTHVAHRLPEWMATVLLEQRRVVQNPSCDGVIAEGIPAVRDKGVKAFVTIMNGCNNFCTYCIVPYVRGRERSRDPELIIKEVKGLVAQGYKEITLLGQNVNSYGKGADHGVDFPELLRRINAIPGDFLIRFMTSHPRDASKRLFDTIAQCEKVSHHFHLPFQSGSDRVLKAMNRHYTRAQYLELIAYARKVIPDISFTSDVIVGFPGETREDFEQTLSLIEEVGFTSLFTFIFSPRKGTPAAEMDDPISAEEKSAWFTEMTALQETVSAKRLATFVGTEQKALLENDAGDYLEARLSENSVVRVQGDPSLLGRYATVRITDARSFILKGEIIKVF